MLLNYSPFFLLALLVAFCTEEESHDENLTIVGRWKLVEQEIGIGSPGKWESVDNGHVFEFKADKSFNVSSHRDCETGTYELTGDTLHLSYNCKGHESEAAYRLETDNPFIILSPVQPICIEGCRYKYEKVKSIDG